MTDAEFDSADLLQDIISDWPPVYQGQWAWLAGAWLAGPGCLEDPCGIWAYDEISKNFVEISHRA